MLRLQPQRNLSFYKRSLRPLYGQQYCYPLAYKYIPARGKIIYPGMVMGYVGEGSVTLGSPILSSVGLCSNFIGGHLDEMGSSDTIGIWQNNASVFEILNQPGIEAFEPGPWIAGQSAYINWEGKISHYPRLITSPPIGLIEEVLGNRLIIRLNINNDLYYNDPINMGKDVLR